MAVETLAEALEREHHEIDAGIEAFTTNPAEGLEPLKSALDALRRHIYLEEEFIFPSLRRSHLVAAIFAMVREHAEIWTTMDEIEGFDLEINDEAKLEELLLQTRQLFDQLERHNSKEEPVIYPCIEEKLSPEESAKVQALMGEGTLPEGWVCQGLRARPS